MNILDRVFARILPGARPREAHAPNAVIVLRPGAEQLRTTAARVRAIASEMALAGVPDVVLFGMQAHPGADWDLPLASPETLAGLCANRPTVFVSSDQHHVSHEWLAELLGKARQSGDSYTHQNYGSPLVSHLRLNCAFTVVGASSAEEIARQVSREGLDPFSIPAALTQLGKPLVEVPISAAGTATFYRRAAALDLPIYFTVETNSSCNYHCLMCPYHGGRQKHKPTFLRPEKYAQMPFDVFKRVVDEIAALPRPYEEEPQVMISPYRRGEFLLYPQWREALAHIKSKAGVRAYFSSNGSLWTDDDIDFVLDIGLDHLQISIEGHDLKTHRRIRLNNEFEKVAGTIRKVIEKREARKLDKPFLQLAHTVNERNYDCVDDYVAHWLRKVDALFLGPENYADDDTGNKRYKVQFSPVAARGAEDRPPCGMVKDNIWVDAEGTVMLCIGSKQTFIGNVHESSMLEILASPVRGEVLAKHSQGDYANGVCKNCEQWYSAYGNTIETERYSAFMSPDTQYYRRKEPIELA